MPVFRTAVMLAGLLLAGCGLPLPGLGGGDGEPAPVAAAISGEAIETSVLPDAAAAGTAGGAANPAPAMAVAEAAEMPADAAAAPSEAMPGSPSEPPPAAPAAAPASAIPPVLAEAAAACTRTGGRYAPSSPGGQSYACFSTPRDAGKSCSAASDCTSACLARSRTCAPAQPLFGCHEVLTDSGLRVTQCLD